MNKHDDDDVEMNCGLRIEVYYEYEGGIKQE